MLDFPPRPAPFQGAENLGNIIGSVSCQAFLVPSLDGCSATLGCAHKSLGFLGGIPHKNAVLKQPTVILLGTTLLSNLLNLPFLI